jgi:hypothetical protein
MHITPRTSTVYVAIVAAVVALILLTSTTLTASVYATKHHSYRSIEDMPLFQSTLAWVGKLFGNF